MATFIFANNINTTLANAISSSSTTIQLASTANLPTSIPAGSYLVFTLSDAATGQNYEIMYATAIVGGTATVLRGQEGTSAQSWGVGDFVFSGPTAGQMANFPQGGGSGVTPGTYGSSTQVAQFTVNSTGQITAAGNVSIAFPITSFNGRAGAIMLNSGDVTTALGYTPLSKSGDTMTGTLSIVNTASTANTTFGFSSSINNGFYFAVSSSGFSLNTLSGSGVFLSQVFSAVSNGSITFPHAANFNANAVYTAGISMQGLGASTTDLSNGIALYLNQIGFGITSGRCNYVVPSANSHVFVVNGADIATVSSSGVTATSFNSLP